MTSFATVPELLRHVASTQSEREAFVEGERRLSFRELDINADRVAWMFWDFGVRPGNVVALMLPSSIDYTICYHGAMRLRAITSGINLRLGQTEISHILDRLQPALTVLDDGLAIPSGCGLALRRSQIRPMGGPAPSHFDLASPQADDPVAIVWTGGTTGKPKGAVFDHRNLKAVALGTEEISLAGDRRYGPVPFPHVNFMTRCWDEISRLVTIVIAQHPWSARTALQAILAEGVNVIPMVPTQWALLFRLPEFEAADLSRVRLVYTGGSNVPAELVMRIKNRLGCPVVVRYASTEISVGTGTHVNDPPEVVANTVGKPVAGVEISLTDESENAVARGRVGRIRCRSAAVMRCYWRDPDLTKQVLSPDGWLSTGDLGWVDEDDNLHIAGRMSDMYIRGGYNVYPIEVEDALSKHPAVIQAAVVGVPDSVLGEIGVAFIVASDHSLNPDELRQWCSSLIADYKLPDAFLVVPELPLTSVNKIDKRALQPIAAEFRATQTRRK
jgi:acyl-CoA synthetase (AMP-forming)/AMP-acid ligase II